MTTSRRTDRLRAAGTAPAAARRARIRVLAPLVPLVLLALGAAPAGAIMPAGAAEKCDARRPELREVVFSGIRVFAKRELQGTIVSQPSSRWRRVLGIVGQRRCLAPEEVPRDVARLLLFFRRRGYPRATVTAQVDSLSAATARLRFTIREGPPLRADSLVIVGQPAGTPLDTGGTLPETVRRVRPGEPLSLVELDSAKLALRRRLQNRGYYTAAVEARTVVDTAAYRGFAVLEATPGPHVRVGEVRVTVTPYPGHKQRVSDAALRGVTGLERGKPLRSRDLETARHNVASTTVYRQAVVRVDTVRPAAARVASSADDGTVPGEAVGDVMVTAAESYPNDLELRAGWATLDCVRIQATLQRSAFLRPTGQLVATARVSKVGFGSPLDFAPWLCSGTARNDPFSKYLNFHLGFTYANPGLGQHPLRRTASIYSERRSEYLAYVRTTYLGATLTASRPLGDTRWVGSTGYELSYGKTIAEPAVLCGVFSACLPEDRARLAEARRLGVVNVVGSRNGTDDLGNPTRGTTLRLETRVASRYVLSDPLEEFFGVRAEGAAYRGLSRQVILAARLRVADVWAAPGKDIPTQERLYAGGATTVRGYQQNELGPQVYLTEDLTTEVTPTGDTLLSVGQSTKDLRHVPSGGNSLIVANAELRMRPPVFAEFLQLVGFVDAGALWNRGGQDGSSSKIHLTPGIGVRAFTPIGAARLDVGYNPYATQRGPVYADVPVGLSTAPLYCLSPGNTLKVTGFGLVDAEGRPIPPVQEEGACPVTFEPQRPDSFLSRLTLHFSFGQAF